MTLEGPLPGWCSNCGRETLQFQSASRQVWLDRDSRLADEVLSPDEFTARGVFRCDFSCTNSTCELNGVVAGRFTNEIVQVSYDEHEKRWTYVPSAVLPGPHLFQLSDEVPDSISTPMAKAFELFWSDLPACAGKCRVVVERLMDDCGVKRTAVAKGKRTRLSLHRRLEAFRVSEPKVAELLLAAKWIGNDGSHDDTLGRSDALDAFVLLETALRQIYDRSHLQAAALAKSINQRKKPRSSGRRRRN